MREKNEKANPLLFNMCTIPDLEPPDCIPYMFPFSPNRDCDNETSKYKHSSKIMQRLEQQM